MVMTENNDDSGDDANYREEMLLSTDGYISLRIVESD